MRYVPKDNDAELAALAALAAAATCGPWVADQREMTLNALGREQFPHGLNPAFRPWSVITAYDHPQLEGPDEITRMGRHVFEEPEYTPCLRAEDAAFIAASRAAVPQLVAEVRALRRFRDCIDAASVAYQIGEDRAPGTPDLDLTAAQGAELARLREEGPPAWVRELRARIAAEQEAQEGQVRRILDTDAERLLWSATLAYGAAQQRTREERDRLIASGWGSYAVAGLPHLDSIAATYAALDALHAAYAAYAGGQEEQG